MGSRVIFFFLQVLILTTAIGQNRKSEEDRQPHLIIDPLLITIDLNTNLNSSSASPKSHQTIKQHGVFLARNTIGIYLDFSIPIEKDPETTFSEDQSNTSLNLFQQVHHFNCSEGCIESFNPAF